MIAESRKSVDPEVSAGTSLGGSGVGKLPLCKVPDTLAPPYSNALGLVAAVQLPERCELSRPLAGPDLSEVETALNS